MIHAARHPATPDQVRGKFYYLRDPVRYLKKAWMPRTSRGMTMTEIHLKMERIPKLATSNLFRTVLCSVTGSRWPVFLKAIKPALPVLTCRYLRVAITLSILCTFSHPTLPAAAEIAKPYTPRPSDRLYEEWRWRGYEELESMGVINATEDSAGNIWFGLERGLIRYDGKSFEELSEKLGIEGIRVHSIFGTKHEGLYIWGGAGKPGLFYFHNNKLTHLVGASKPDWLPNERRANMVEAADGSVWSIGGTGLLRIEGGELRRYQMLGIVFDDLSFDRWNNLWAIQRETGELHRFAFNGKDWDMASAKIIRPPLETKSDDTSRVNIVAVDDEIWVTTNLNGFPLLIYNQLSNTWRNVDLSKVGSTNVHYQMTVDADGGVWITGSLSLMVFKNKQWSTYTAERFKFPGNYHQILHASDHSIWFISNNARIQRLQYGFEQWGIAYEGLVYQREQPLGTHWYFSENNEVVIHNEVTGRWRAYDTDHGLMNKPLGLLFDREGTPWVYGSHGTPWVYGSVETVASVAYFDGKRWQRQDHPGFATDIRSLCALVTGDGRIVFGSGSHPDLNRKPKRRGRLLVYSKRNNRYRSRHINKPRIPPKLFTIAEGPDGGLWLLSHRRLVVLKGNIVTEIQMPDTTRVAPKRHIVIDNTGVIWIATQGAGIHRFDGQTWKQYTTEEGLAGNTVSNIFLLEEGRLVVSTNGGFSLFDGFVWSDFIPAIAQHMPVVTSIYRSNDNSFRINYYYRDLLHKPEVTSIPYDNKSLRFKTLSYRMDDIAPDTTVEIFNTRIEHDSFNHILWSAKDNWSSMDNPPFQYSYRLNDGEWSRFSPRQQQIFGDLKPGSYRLQVRARDSNLNIDPTPAQVDFEVLPALWQQTWFLASVLFAIILVAIFIGIIIRIREKHLLEIGDMKVSFFSNVSHELRTPLTLILGPLETLLTKRAFDEKNILLIQRNAQRLMNLVNQLLDFRQLNLGKMEYVSSIADFVEHFRSIAELMRPLAENKHISYTVDVPDSSGLTMFDTDKSEKIINNLIGNAIKYTPQGGTIKVSLRIQDGAKPDDIIAQLQIEDSGIGIEAEQAKQIFDQFYRVSEHRHYADGSGIGLALVKEMVDLCKGDIDVVSPIETIPGEGKKRGTRFTVNLPMKRVKSVHKKEHTGYELNPVDMAIHDEEQQQALAAAVRDKIMVVEDNREIREFIVENLETQYDVLTANNGFTALSAARDVLPDLIISDVIMPIMDGVEMCDKLKHDEITCHIPVILLTAKGSHDSRLSGYSAGADEYLKKPFQMSVLKSRIENLLESRRRMREKFGGEILLRPTDTTITPTDEQFLQRAITVVEENMSDENFTVHDFSRAMGIKHKTLYAKIKSLTNQSLQGFIRTIRLEKALQLLQHNELEELTVSEISAKVGFLELSYFSRCFKKQFGFSPTEVQKVPKQPDPTNQT